MEKIPEKCDLVYEQYGVRYGIELEELFGYLEEGRTPIIVVNDVRAVEDLKSVFGSLVVSVFLYRRPAVYQEIYEEEKERTDRKMDEEYLKTTARTRYEKAQAIYRIYIENIYLFDKVILNVSDIQNTERQVGHVVKVLKKDLSKLNSQEEQNG